MDRQSGRLRFRAEPRRHIAFAAAYIAVLVTVSAYGFHRAAQQLPAVPDPAFPHISRYPRVTLLKHREGTVVLNRLVLQDGEVGDVRFIGSSGYSQLDAAAQVEAGYWRYLPAVRNGTPVSA